MSAVSKANEIDTRIRTHTHTHTLEHVGQVSKFRAHSGVQVRGRRHVRT